MVGTTSRRATDLTFDRRATQPFRGSRNFAHPSTCHALSVTRSGWLGGGSETATEKQRQSLRASPDRIGTSRRVNHTGFMEGIASPDFVGTRDDIFVWNQQAKRIYRP